MGSTSNFLCKRPGMYDFNLPIGNNAKKSLSTNLKINTSVINFALSRF